MIKRFIKYIVPIIQTTKNKLQQKDRQEKSAIFKI